MLLLRKLTSCSLARLRIAFTVATLYFGVVLVTLVGRQTWTHTEPIEADAPTQLKNGTCAETISWNFRSTPPGSVSQDGGGPVTWDEQFQQINTFNAYVYSAFGQPYANDVYNITVLGVTDVHYPGVVFCFVGDRKTKTVLKGRRVLLPESHDNSTGVASFFCLFKGKPAPLTVSLAFKANDVPTNEVLIMYPQTMRRDVTTCYAVLFNYQRPLHLIQSIEMNRVLGSQHFFVYNHSVSNTTDAVLRHYQRLGLLTVLQWRLPPLDIWYYGQVLAINDCVYRNRFVSVLVAIQDTDELILPSAHNSFTEVVEFADLAATLNDTSPGNVMKKPAGTYVFESTLHFAIPDISAWREVTREFSIVRQEEDFMFKYCITPFLQLQRMNKIFNYNYRSKAIVRPELVIYAGIHFTHQHWGQATNLVVKNDLAIVHHYNSKIYFGNTTFQTEASGLDSSIFRFKQQILAKLEVAFEAVGLT